MKYTLFIDESGDFESSRGQWLISGFLCSAELSTSEKALEDACQVLPSKLGVKSIRDFHLTEFRSNFGHKEALNKAQTFINALDTLPFEYHFLTTINESKIKISNREKTYRLMLFDLLSLFESGLPDGHFIEQLDIVVATRTINGVRQTNISDIEDDVIRKLPQALEVDLATKGLVDIIGSKIKLHMDYANNSWGLVAADFLANINYHNKREPEVELLKSLKQKGLFTGFKTFNRYQERRAFVAERDADFSLASVRWILMLEGENTKVAVSGLNRSLISLFTNLGVAGAKTAFENVLDRLWRLCKPKLEYERFIRLLITLKGTLTSLNEQKLLNLDVFIYRTNVFLLKVVNHTGETKLALNLLNEQKSLLNQVIFNPDNLSLIMDGLLVESEIFYNDLDFEEALLRAKQSYEVANNYSSLSAIILENDELADSCHSVIFLKAKMNYLRHVIRKEQNHESLVEILSTLDELVPFLPANDFSRYRAMKVQVLIKLEKYHEAILVTLDLFQEDSKIFNAFDKLAFMKAINASKIKGLSVSEKMKKTVESFAFEPVMKISHPHEALFREIAIFYYLENNKKLANKFIRKSEGAISANKSNISDFLYADNAFLQDLFKNRLDNSKNYMSKFSIEIDTKLENTAIIQTLTSHFPF